jgi:hypothetical protein
MESGSSVEWLERGDMFIPGLSDEITLEHIATKVSWRTLFALISVNRAWRRAIQEREIYDVRMRTHQGQTVVVFSVDRNRQQGFYEVEDHWMCLLPPLPRSVSSLSPGNIQKGVRAVMLDSRLFVLGDFQVEGSTAIDPTRSVRGNNKRDIHFVDLGSCRLNWRPGSSVTTDSPSSICVACDEKIYTFSMRDQKVHGEVFDPRQDKWSQIVDEPPNVCKIFTYDGRVACLNKEIYVSSFGEKIMVFDTATERWREVKNTLPNRKSVSWVVIDEKLYNLSSSNVDVYDFASNTWALVQPISSENFQHALGITPYPIKVAPLRNEVVALLEHDLSFPDGSFIKLYKSVGFGVQGYPLVWEEFPCSALQTSLNTHNSFLTGSVEI